VAHAFGVGGDTRWVCGAVRLDIDTDSDVVDDRKVSKTAPTSNLYSNHWRS
jgi:hypothetical protein